MNFAVGKLYVDRLRSVVVVQTFGGLSPFRARDSGFSVEIQVALEVRARILFDSFERAGGSDSSRKILAMTLPQIFILIETPVLGELGAKTVIRREVACLDCGKLKLIREHVEYSFDRWNEQDLFTAYGLLFVTARLKNALESNNIKGLAYHEATVSLSSGFKLGKKVAHQEGLAQIFWIEVTAEARGPDSWWDRANVCNSCGHQKWTPTRGGIRSAGGPSSTGTKKDVESPLPLRVFSSEWNGEDIFLLEEPGQHPIVSAGFKRILEDLGNKQVYFRPTNWV